MRVSSISFAIVAISSSCDGLSFSLPFISINQANPAVTKYAAAQENALLKIHLDIGQEVNVRRGTTTVTGDRLGVDGLLVELRGKEDANYKQ